MKSSATSVHPYFFSRSKRAFDITFGIALLLGLLPLLLLISIVILASSGLPIFFTQKRMGRHKKPFAMYKFRVMYMGADKDQWRHTKHNEAPAPMYKNWRDPRFVGIGKWLSLTGLDELPQLIHIIKGEMSFVGPRPLPIQEAEKLNVAWNFRYLVKPGIFSEWSISPTRHQSLQNWRRLELETLKKGGLIKELTTIIKTIGRMYS